MLTADQIETLGNQAQKLLDPVQEYLIREIASRISEAGSMTATAQYQVWRLQNLGVSQRKLKKELRRLLKISHRDLRKLLENAGEEGYTYDMRQLPQVQASPFRESRVMQDIVSAAVDLAREDLTNITQTIGFCLDPQGKVCLPLTEAYEQACDQAFMKVATGAQDFRSAVREATQGLAKKGIQYIDYESGIHTSLEAATRRSVMGGMGLMQEKISQGVHDEYGCTGGEISAHACSAPDHEPIQGKQYSDEAYQKLNNSLRRRIGTLNCGHAAHPIMLGISRPQYTEKELQKFRQDNETGVEIDEEHLTMYEATQKQRAIERAMRAQKKKILVAEATGDPNLPQLQSRMQVLSQEYSRFSDQAGLRTQVERTHVEGFEYKQSREATKAYRHIEKQKTVLKIAEEHGIISLPDKSFNADIYTEEQYQKMLSERSIVHKSKDVRSLLPEGKKNSISDFILEDGTIDQRRVYGSDGKAIIDYDTSDHGRPKLHPTGAHKHMWNYDNKRPRGSWKPLTDQELMLNSDIIKKGENYHDPKTEESD